MIEKLEQLRRQWRAPESQQTEVQQRIWDRLAENYSAKPLPSWETDPFLKLMADSFSLDHTMRTLDIGCGSGVYSLALAPLVQEVVGVDISPRMIEAAQGRSQALSLSNTSFCCMPWAGADMDALGFRGAFDVVFAHMTPAVCDYETFDKLNACSRNLCMVEKPTRRTDQVLDGAFRQIGLEPKGANAGDMVQSFAYLWAKGYAPQFYYRDEVWESQKPVEDTAAWCIDRARLQKELTPAEENSITGYVKGLAVNGLVHEITKTTRVTMIWRVSL